MTRASTKGDGERTDDGHYIVIGGRRWRTSDPSIPDGLRAQLVNELMAARRAVRLANEAGCGLAAARRRVNDAKVALGERGEPWWQSATPEGRRQRIVSTMRTMLRARTPPSTLCPSEVARSVGGETWRALMPEVRSVAADLRADRELVVVQRGEPVEDLATVKGPIRYRRPEPARSLARP